MGTTNPFGDKMGFAGTIDRCNACNKVVHFIDYMTVDGIIYHKSCFKCTHCKGNLVMYNYSSMDGVLYCKPHFEQLFKETGNFNKNFRTTKQNKENSTARAPHKFASFFTGTQDKCPTCKKTVYPLEQITMEGEPYHKRCFKCAYRGCPLTHSSYAAHNSVLYCRHHFSQLFLEKGDFAHVLKAAKKNENEQAEKAPEQETEDKTKPETTSESDE
ncbi:hypothetical protein L6452_33190 [Arctium lappa]|uniref:Uncharacterized protein n=1 Tax=Arctium lappa TaxID=4217 RepID=A0ACB8ZBB3_ARCLA|nr:hypothetical protein L6452_33190 [Arctium lappa]